VNGVGRHKDSSRTTEVGSSGLVSVFYSDESHSVYVLVLPRVAPNLGRDAVAACGAFLLPDMIGATAASAASDVSLGSATGPKRGRALSHSRSPASAKRSRYLCQPSGSGVGSPVRHCRL